MVDVGVLAGDVLQFWVLLALPALLVLLLYLFAWEDPGRSGPAGFGPRTFWLLIMGGLLGIYSFLPFFRSGGIYLGVSLAGGLIPLLLSAWFLGRELGGARWALPVFLLGFGAESAASFLVVYLLGSSGWATALGLLATTAAPPLLLGAAGALSAGPWRARLGALAVFLGLCSAALYGTFLSTEALPPYGIVSTFPWYLITPLVVGALAGLAAPWAFRRSTASAVPVGYAAVTFGVLVGADVLHQIPLYQPGTSALYIIGGAGPADLLYLSGLIALAPAYLLVRLRRRPAEAVRPVPEPARELRSSTEVLHAGRFADSVQASQRATRDSESRTRAILDATGAARAGPTGPPWAEADRANLRRLAEAPAPSSADAARAYVTAQALVSGDRRLALSGFAPFSRRAWAFLLDLGVLVGLSLPLWLYAVGQVGATSFISGTAPAALALELAFPMAGFAYFAVLESMAGTTVGKHLLGLVVRTPALRRPSWRAGAVRTVPRLLVLTLIGLLGPAALAVLMGGAGALGPPPGTPDVAIGVTVALVGVLVEVVSLLGLTGLVSFAIMAAGPERQRLGDLWARTWVLRAPARVGPPVGVPAA